LFPLLTQKQGGGGYPKEVREAKEVEEVKELDYKRAFLTPAFTTTSIDIVGAPTFLFLHAIGRSQERPASEGGPYTNFELSRMVDDLSRKMIFAAELLCDSSSGDFNRLEDSAQDLELSTFNFERFFSPNSSYSRRYAREPRKSNHSRTYAKTGGWGSANQMDSPITLLFS
jgi:hypothetical protein